MNTISLKELVRYVIYQKADVAIVSPDRYEQRMTALSFCLLADQLVLECGTYYSHTRCLVLEIGSRVYFGYEPKHFQGLNLHAAVFGVGVGDVLRQSVAARVRVPVGLGLVALRG